jgi:hypothetical protein
VQASGTSPANVVVTDLSTDGADPDPGGDGPGNDGTPTPIVLQLVVGIPALDGKAMLLLMVLLAAAGAFAARRL